MNYIVTNLNKHAAVLTMIVVLGAFVYLQWVSVAYLIFAGSIVFAMIVTRWL